MQPRQGTVSNITNNLEMVNVSGGIATDLLHGTDQSAGAEASAPLASDMIAEMDPLVAWILGLEVPKANTIQDMWTAGEKFEYSKCPSVISEPRWVAFSSTISDTGLQSAPSEYFAWKPLLRLLETHSDEGEAHYCPRHGRPPA